MSTTTNNDKMNQLIPMILTDYVMLPSEGLFYQTKTDRIKVEYMTAFDEQYLLSEKYLKDGSGFEFLAENKIKDPVFTSNQMKVDDLLTGDFDAVLMFLRIGAYGNEYEVSVRDTNGEYFTTKVDLLKLENKKLIHPNDEFMFDFELPMTKQNVVFKLLTVGEKKMLDKRIERISKYKEQELFPMLERMKTQIISIAGETDRSFIEKFVMQMPPKDSLALRLKMMDVEPGIDFSYEFQGKFTGDFFRSNFQLTASFFYPGR